MKQVTVFDGLRESEIRPQGLFNEYLRILERDISRFFADRDRYVAVSCPACDSRKQEPAFAKLGFSYVRCLDCRSVFVSPRPSKEMFEAYELGSDTAKFWSDHFLKETAKERNKSIFNPRALWIQSYISQSYQRPWVFADVYSKYRTFLEEIAALRIFDENFLVAPLGDGVTELASQIGFQVVPDIETGLSDQSIQAQVVSAQECLERVYSPKDFLQATWRILSDGGLLFITTMTASGFDLQVLGGKAKNLMPPTHINLLSIEGLRQLVEGSGFAIVELSTPGQLDTEIVLHALEEDPSIDLPPFVSDLIRRRDARVHQAFQEFLQQALLSSHVRMVARKRGYSSPSS